MPTLSAPADSPLARLADALPGRVVRPADAGWDDARRAWNLAVDQRPAAVAMPESAEEVAHVVRAAREAGLALAVQGTGHGAGAHRTLEGALLLSTARMRGVEVDPAARRARVAAGALWGDVVPAASAHGLAALHGSSASVGVVGYTLGGGLGWLSRRHGLACNAVTAVELVSAEGRLIRADAATEPDLFWAVRGGGGGFGVVTALEFRLLPVAQVTSGWLVWDQARAGEVLRAWSRWTETVPEDVTSVGRLLSVPPLPGLPEWLAGRKVVVVEVAALGDPAEADRVLGPLRALAPEIDTVSTGPAADLVTLHMDPPEPVPGVSAGALVDALPDEAVAELLAVAGPDSGTPLLSVELRHLGGALDRIPAGAGALAFLDGGFALLAVGMAPAPEAATAVDTAAAEVVRRMDRFGYGRRYLNFADRPTDTRAAFDAGTHARLRAVRDRLDPDGLLRPNHPLGGLRSGA